jgi:AraC family transcriptional regulator
LIPDEAVKMDWVRSLNKSIDYIEDNLLENLSCAEIADHIYISSAHFQRVFSLLTGMTTGEYIRNRRLSLAGQELNTSDIKVIDTALKYGYESPESFTKAFTRFHGITPSQAKRQGCVIKSFSRLVIKIYLEGGNIMDYSIVEKKSFTVAAKMRTYTSESGTKEIPSFWAEYMSDGSHEKVCGMFGICEPEKKKGEFRYGIGAYWEGAKVPDGFELITIPANTWAMFKCTGPMPGAIQDLWKRVYSEWLPKADFELVSDYDFEVYTEDDVKSKDYKSEIWIPVKKK